MNFEVRTDSLRQGAAVRLAETRVHGTDEAPVGPGTGR